MPHLLDGKSFWDFWAEGVGGKIRAPIKSFLHQDECLELLISAWPFTFNSHWKLCVCIKPNPIQPVARVISILAGANLETRALPTPNYDRVEISIGVIDELGDETHPADGMFVAIASFVC